MTERKQRKSSQAQEKRKEAAQVEREQKLQSLLDSPLHPDQASPIRGWAYFAVIIGVALILNFAVMVILSGGR